VNNKALSPIFSVLELVGPGIYSPSFFQNCTMPPSFAQSAHTLPRNFTFHYHDGQPPRTPEPIDRDEKAQPPPLPPPRDYGEPYRLRRRRPQLAAAQRSYRAIYPDASAKSSDTWDVPLPSIEISDAPTGFHHTSLSIPESTGLQAIAALNSRPISPPKTPVAQIYSTASGDDGELGGEDSSSQGESLTRPSTACSGFSDSSKSSSIESFPSLNGYCTSPELESLPSFGAPELNLSVISSPLQSYGRSTMASTPLQQKPTWTKDMEDHLWITYMRYLQDPTHTPFKMLPGTSPPLGVCARVVREAKRTWKGARTTTVPRVYRFARWGSNRLGSPEAVQSQADRITSDNDNRKANPAWPRSDAATRKKLRDLCKHQPTLSAHYGRILRSPSPFLSSARSRSASMAREVLSPHSRSNDSSVFSTRDMNISLATSISSTMHFGNPLSQLTSDAATPRPRAGTQFEIPSGRSPGHQKSQSLHFGVGLGGQARGLASPFRPTTLFHNSRPETRDSLDAPALSAEGPSLASPVELHAPVPRRGFFKRPAPGELDDALNSEDPFTRQNHLMKELFGPPQAAEPAHRRVRSRGFSLGDMSSSSRLSSLFTPLSPDEAPGSSLSRVHTVTETNTPAAGSMLQPPPSFAGILRLGSPFAEKPSKQHFNTFPRNFSLSGLEPAMEMNEELHNSRELPCAERRDHV
jgi:hypothetical protein